MSVGVTVGVAVGSAKVNDRVTEVVVIPPEFIETTVKVVGASGSVGTPTISQVGACPSVSPVGRAGEMLHPSTYPPVFEGIRGAIAAPSGMIAGAVLIGYASLGAVPVQTKDDFGSARTDFIARAAKSLMVFSRTDRNRFLLPFMVARLKARALDDSLRAAFDILLFSAARYFTEQPAVAELLAFPHVRSTGGTL